MDLAAVFDLPAAGGRAKARLIPSFEFVKFKYFLAGENENERRSPQDFGLWAWLIGIAPFVLIAGGISWFSFGVLLRSSFSEPLAALIGNLADPQPWVLATISAFLGAYLANMRHLYRAINNFDLSPALFVSSAIDIASGVALSILMAVGFNDLFSINELADGALVLLAFAIGFLPSATIRDIMNKSRLSSFKRENAEIYKSFSSTPVEIIDGINTGIRDRLEDYHITSVQNLAAANPLMLFVEAPYGVYQIMDWVAQAQLCSTVGPSAIVRLWGLGIRTLFDLERLALDPRCYNKELLLAVGEVMLGSAKAQPERPVFTEESFKANIQLRLDDPHVHRLRQIYMQVGERIGRQHSRFNGTEPLRVITSASLEFVYPHTLRDKNAELGGFRVGDKIGIQGGANSTKVLTVNTVSSSELHVDEPVSASSGELVSVIRFS